MDYPVDSKEKPILGVAMWCRYISILDGDLDGAVVRPLRPPKGLFLGAAAAVGLPFVLQRSYCVPYMCFASVRHL